LFFVLALTACNHSNKTTLLSPDKKYTLITSINQNKSDQTKYLCVTFKIIDVSSGKCIFYEQTGASDNMKWKMEWDGTNRVWLNSSDIGLYYWEKQDNGIWKKFTYEKDISPHLPDSLNEI
jgi:hypothetical protein